MGQLSGADFVFGVYVVYDITCYSCGDNCEHQTKTTHSIYCERVINQENLLPETIPKQRHPHMQPPVMTSPRFRTTSYMKTTKPSPWQLSNIIC